MNPGWVPAIVAAIAIIFDFGMNYNRLRNLEENDKKQDTRLDGHDEDIKDLQTQARIENARREGIAEGKALQHLRAGQMAVRAADED